MFEITCPLNQMAQIAGNQPCLLNGAEMWTYAMLEARVVACAQSLRALRLPSGTRVALCLPSSAEWVVLFFALHRVRWIPCLLSPRLPPAAQTAQAAFCGCPIGFREKGSSGERQKLRWMRLADLPEESPSSNASPLPVRYEGEGHAAILFTSGSTGTPRAAVLSHRAFYANARGANQNMPVGLKDVWLASLPFWHVGGLGILYRCLLGGAAFAFPIPGKTLAENIEVFQITHLSVVSTQLVRLLSAPPSTSAIRHLKGVLLGGGPSPIALLVHALQAGFPVRQSYGLTEAASQVATVPRYFHDSALFTAGKPLPSRDLRIDSTGQIHVRGTTLFSGYLQKDGSLDLPLDEHGWFATGDLGRWDARGHLCIIGRMDNLFISGGENIQPEEIEAAIRELPGVEEAIVVPVEDKEYGQRPLAFCRMNPPIAYSILSMQLRNVLPGFKIPVAFHPLPESNAQGLKPSRAALRKLANELYPS